MLVEETRLQKPIRAGCVCVVVDANDSVPSFPIDDFCGSGSITNNHIPAWPGCRHADNTKRKENTYPELQGRNGRVRMVVIAGEVGGRWSEETKAFLWSLACEKSRSEARVLRGSVRAAWYRRWSCLLACAAAKAVAMSLLERRGVPGAGDEPPSAHEVVSATFREEVVLTCYDVLVFSGFIKKHHLLS